MKFCLLVASILTVLSYSVAKSAENDPAADIRQVTGCEAAYVSLSHLHTQIAASMTALSGPVGLQKLGPMIKSYSDIAKSEHQKYDDTVNTMKETLMPALIGAGMPPSMLLEHLTQDLAKSLTSISDSLADPTNTIEEQTTKEKALLEQADSCDALVHDILKRNTF